MMRAVSLENYNFLKPEIDFYCANCDFSTAKEKKLFYGYVSFSITCRIVNLLFSNRAKKITLYTKNSLVYHEITLIVS